MPTANNRGHFGGRRKGASLHSAVRSLPEVLLYNTINCECRAGKNKQSDKSHRQDEIEPSVGRGRGRCGGRGWCCGCCGGVVNRNLFVVTSVKMAEGRFGNVVSAEKKI